MLTRDQVLWEIAAHRLNVAALSKRFAAGERSTVGVDARACADALLLLRAAALEQRAEIDALVEHCAALKLACDN